MLLQAEAEHRADGSRPTRTATGGRADGRNGVEGLRNPRSNHSFREEDREMVPYCQDSGVGLMPWSPLARGILSRPWQSPASSREQTVRFLRRIIRDRETECDGYISNRVEEVAARRGVSMGLSRYRIKLQGQDRRGLRVRLSEDDIKYQKSRTSRR
jgi:hypothetical protein